MSAEIVLDLQDVTVPSRRDAETPVITEVNWSVRAAEFWVVGGLQGAGKSDLIFMLAGLTKPLAGCYKLLGQDMGQHFGDEFLPSRLRLGMVFFDARRFNHLPAAGHQSPPQ